MHIVDRSGPQPCLVSLARSWWWARSSGRSWLECSGLTSSAKTVDNRVHGAPVFASQSPTFVPVFRILYIFLCEAWLEVLFPIPEDGHIKRRVYRPFIVVSTLFLLRLDTLCYAWEGFQVLSLLESRTIETNLDKSCKWAFKLLMRTVSISVIVLEVSCFERWIVALFR